MQALIWDVDGTLAETERDGHRVAFNRAFETLGLPWRWDEAHYGHLLKVTGGLERLMHDMTGRPDAPADVASLARELHRLKGGFYAEIVDAGGIGLRPGVRELIDDCAACGVRLAIATTTGRANVDALLAASGLGGFEVVLCAEDAPVKKPDPQVFERTLRRLALRPEETLALEDSPAGALACCAAGVPVVVTRSVYFADAPLPPVLAVGPGLHTSIGWEPRTSSRGAGSRIDIGCLARWHEQDARFRQTIEG